MWGRKKSTTLTSRILIAMIAGAILGVTLNFVGAENEFVKIYLIDGIFHVGGAIFVSALKLLVVPLVFISLVCGIMSLTDVRTLGRVSAKAIGYFLVSTCIAISIALTLAVMTSPGQGISKTAASSSFQAKETPELTQVLIDLVPSNPVASMANGEMIQIIVFALIFGLSISLAGERARKVADLFLALNDVAMKMVVLIMLLAPVGVFCLIAKTFATQGINIILPLATYFITLVAALVVQLCVVHAGALAFIGRLNPLIFFRKMRAALLFAFSTASSGATIPIALETVEHRLGVRNSIASFTVPLGATINMDGTAIMQGVATVFIANVYGVALGPYEYVMVILTATLASIGSAGVPGVGLVMLTMILNQIGLPVEGIALIIGVDRLLDMMRTAVNISGDAVISCIVARSEGAIDMKVFNDPEAGRFHEGDLKVTAPGALTPTTR